jgi:uncharacterized protein
MEPRKRNELSRSKVASIVIAAACAIAVAVSSAATAAPPQMIVYRAGEKVPESELFDLGPPEGLGGTVLEGDPKISARIDYAQGNLLAGVFQATRGTVLIHFPFTEHATILTGEVELTDEWGNRAHLGAGDSYFITQGSVILWEVHGDRVQKTFFNRTTEDDPPAAPMIIYKVHDEIAQSDLIDLGPPEGLGGTVQRRTCHRRCVPGNPRRRTDRLPVYRACDRHRGRGDANRRDRSERPPRPWRQLPDHAGQLDLLARRTELRAKVVLQYRGGVTGPRRHSAVIRPAPARSDLVGAVRRRPGRQVHEFSVRRDPRRHV